MQNHANLLFLFRQLLTRELELKYKTTVLGVLWLVLQPILMLCVYTLVFSGIFKARWVGAQNPGDFALMLFAGLIPFAFLSEILVTSPSMIVGQPNFVKKVVFPLPILVTMKVAAAMITALLSLLILLAAQLIFSEPPTIKVLLAPVILLEMVPMLLAIGWILSALGVYLRDIGQFVGILSSVLLFLSPIFFPPSAMPKVASGLIAFNPLVTPIGQLRAATLGHEPLDLSVLGNHFVISIIAAMLAYALFKRLSRGFADVL